MPTNLSTKKRLRQDDVKRIRNKGVKSELKTLIKKLDVSVEAKDKQASGVLLREIVSKLDRAARTHVLHHNTTARRKSKFTRMVNAIES